MRAARSLMMAAAICSPHAQAWATTPASTHEERARHAVYAELGGPGLLYSLNYEHHLAIPVALRAGASFWQLSEQGTQRAMSAALMPLSASYLVGWGNHHLEVGLGLTWGLMRSDLNQRADLPVEQLWLLSALAQVGYRYQPVSGGLVFRATFTPMVSGDRFAPLGSPYMLWGGLSVGWAR